MRSWSAELRFGRSRLCPRPAWLPLPLQMALCGLVRLPPPPPGPTTSRVRHTRSSHGISDARKTTRTWPTDRPLGNRISLLEGPPAYFSKKRGTGLRPGFSAELDGHPSRCRRVALRGRVNCPRPSFVSSFSWHKADFFQHHFPTGRVCVRCSEPTRHRTSNT